MALHQVLLILVTPFVLALRLGGFEGSGGVPLWSWLAPIGAILFLGRRQALAIGLAFVAATFVTIGPDLTALQTAAPASNSYARRPSTTSSNATGTAPNGDHGYLPTTDDPPALHPHYTRDNSDRRRTVDAPKAIASPRLAKSPYVRRWWTPRIPHVLERLPGSVRVSGSIPMHATVMGRRHG